MLHALFRRFPRPALLLAAALLAGAAHGAAVSGAGSSAAAPVYTVWGSEYQKEHGHNLQYASVGSGAGLAKIRQRSVDFGASDFIETPSELERDGLVMVPTVITGVVPVVNLPKVAPNALRLSGEVLARIFLREITRWDAPEIKALNPQLTLPDQPIRLVVRADGSGTTYHFSDYLSRVNAGWKKRFGVAAKFDWPAEAIAVKGSGEVSKTVRATPGAIGYIDYNYVLDDQLTGVSMRNADGQFVAAGVDGFRDAVMHSRWYSEGDFSGELNDAHGEHSWPITMGTYVAVPKVARSKDGTEAALRFVTWGYMNGDALARKAKFVPLPVKVQANAYREIATVVSADGEKLGLKLIGPLMK
jgi:phosphate transport system substrate-binding protein